MPQNIYDLAGRWIGTSETHEEAVEKANAMWATFVFIVAAAPILLLAFSCFWSLRELHHWHPAVAAILMLAISGGVCALLYRFVIVSLVYFGLYTVTATAVAFLFVVHRSDCTWASLAAVFVAAVGGSATYRLVRHRWQH